MAVSACCRRRLVEQHLVAIDKLLEYVACGASYILMTAFKRESRLFMVKQRRPPLVAIVA